LNVASIDQNGSGTSWAMRNDAFIKQAGNGFTATVTQTGNTNLASVYQH
jgi:hypothetical protein